MKKIVYLSPLYFNEKSCLGGGERYPLNCARGVAEASRGTCTVEIISYDKKPAYHEFQPGVSLRLLPAAKFADPLNVLSWDLPAALAQADLVHIHQAAMRASEVALWVAKLQGKLICVTDHGSTTSTVGIYQDRLEVTDRIVCYSDYGASLFHTKTPIEVIKGGVDCSFFQLPADRRQRDRVLYVGRLVPHKGVDQLIEAMPNDMLLTVCGRPYHKAYYAKLKDLSKNKRVEFVTDADDADIRSLYHRSWANVLPSLYEDCYGQLQPAPELMGLTLLEAMACGTPAICSNVGAMPEFVRHGETGFVYDHPEQLTDYLNYLRERPEVAEQIGQRARQVVEREFDYRVVGRKLLGLYERMTGSRVMEAAA
ncbi:MAG TPA: glycosyltransferase family 4 protein [Gemmataceae bacterium]|nr:glycosyltransferase family 4 protein [Gemmataceae bacterium]